MTEIYKEVRLIGPDPRKKFSSLFSDGFRETEGCLIVGDGKEYLSEEEIKKQLTGRIDQNTRVHICAHGGIIEGDNHVIELIKSTLINTSFILTSSILKLIDGLTKGPVQVYIQSCYSGAINGSISCLKEGSVLVTNSDANLSSYNSPFMSSFKIKDKSPEAIFLNSIRSASQTITFNKNIGNNNYFRFSYIPFANHLLDMRNTASKYIWWAENLFITKIIECRFFSNERLGDLPMLEKASEKDVKQTFLMHVIYLIRTNKISPQDSLKLLESESLTVDAISKGLPLLYYLVNGTKFNKEMFEAYVKAGADVNAISTEGLPLLCYVATGKMFNKEAFKSYVKAGVDVNAISIHGLPLLCYVASCDIFNKEAFEAYVKAEANVNAISAKGFPLLYYAANGKEFNIETFAAYVKAGANVNARSIHGLPLLCYVAYYDIFNKEAFEAYVEAGADVNAKSEKGFPLLCYLTNGEKFNKAAFEAYVDKNADVTAETDSGEPIITEFLKSNRFNKNAIEAMLRSGATLPQDKPLNVNQGHWHIAQELSKEFFKDDKDPLNKFNTRRELSKSVNFSKMFSCEDVRYALSSAKSFCARICSSQTDRKRRVR